MFLDSTYRMLGRKYMYLITLMSIQVQRTFQYGKPSHFSDIDECKTNTDKCQDDATCVNTIGGYNCTCNPGFNGDGYNCTGTLTFLYIRWNCSLASLGKVVYVIQMVLVPRFAREIFVWPKLEKRKKNRAL